jgi:hypothetical protein
MALALRGYSTDPMKVREVVLHGGYRQFSILVIVYFASKMKPRVCATLGLLEVIVFSMSYPRVRPTWA